MIAVMTPTEPPRPALPTVCGFGLIVFDQQAFVGEYPAPDSKVFADEVRTQVGGPVPTALAQLRRFGIECRMFGLWAGDAAGREIEADLTQTGIDFDPLECRKAERTGFAQIWVEKPTGRRTVVSAPPACEPDPAAAAAFGRGARVLHLDGWGGDAAVAAAEAARRSGGLVTLDSGSVKPSTDRLLPLVDIVNAPLRFLRSYCGTDDPQAGAERLLDSGVRLVTVTDGDRGAGVFTRDVAVWRPAFDVRAVDTCGAGDVFCGGLIHAVLAGMGPVDCLRWAMATAAIKVSRVGNREALPDRPEVEALLDRDR